MNFTSNSHHSLLLMFLGTMAVGVPAFAQEATSPATGDARYYGGFHVARNTVNDWKNTVKLGADVEVDGRVETDPKEVLGFVVGREKRDAGESTSIRYELEYQLGRFEVHRVDAGFLSETVSGKGKYQALTANAYLQKHWNDWSAYVGLGAGLGKANLPNIALSNGCDCIKAASKSGLALLGRAGMEYRINSNHNVFAQYTWLNLQGPTSGGGVGVAYDRKWISAASVGYRYDF